MNWRALKALVRKDLKVTLSDRRAVMISFVVPVALASFMALIMGGAGESGGAGKIDIRVADEDQSPLTAKILKSLDSEKNLKVIPSTAADAREGVRKGNVAVAVVFPKGFGAAASKALFRGVDKPDLLMYRDPSHSAETGMVRGLLMQHVMQSVSADAFNGAGGMASVKESMADIEASEGMSPSDKKTLVDMMQSILKWQERAEVAKADAAEKKDAAAPRTWGFSAPFETKEEVVTAGGQVSRTAMSANAFAGSAVQFILFGAIEAGVGLLTERQRGLWKRVRAAPISKLTVLGSRIASGTILAFLVVPVVFGFGALAFHLRVDGSFVGFVLISAAYALVAATFGLLIAAIGNSPGSARGISILVVLLMVLLGGAWIPSFLFPPWLLHITPALPTRWAVDGFNGTLWRGFTLMESLKYVAALLGFSALFGGLAFLRFRWEEN